MRTLIICKSIHHGNTQKIAEVIANVLEAKLVEPEELDISMITEYDLVGFGSGIYYGKHHKDLLRVADSLPSVRNKKAFIFSTSGTGEKNVGRNHRLIKEKLMAKGFTIVGEFSCRGLDSFGLLKLIGGINKGKPDENDLKRAEDFARRLKDS
ncbi:MAG: hypothetical protein PWP57_712 [Candidatus Atribacteria bacterium]|nr:hypothetical protein [Candidatus Atribacteria bacterium]